MTYNIFALLFGITLLCAGSNWLVNGTSALALSFSIRPIIVGLTILAFATSAPEFFVSLIAIAKGSVGVSIGNIIGSNITNITLGIGLSAIVKPLIVDKKIEILFMIGVSFLFWLLCIDGLLGRLDGYILLICLAAFLIYGLFFAKYKNNYEIKEYTISKKKSKRYLVNTFFIISGFMGLLLGSNLIVKSAIFMAKALEFSETFVGLSIVAVGTSLPEIATSIAAVEKNENDLLIGNVVGSNIFNICLVMGTIALLSPLKIEIGLNRFEFPMMIMISILLFIFCKKKKITSADLMVIFSS
mmetsp:Transcript_13669/g.6764  ORF Transcript_13669/g.6764 Transcript_13669/m.6764 type:complete len:300 (-) Transcript_13669:440-1339(-)